MIANIKNSIYNKLGSYMDIKRINELANKQRECGLTDEEKKEQQILRTEYINAFRQSLKSQLDNIVIVDENGNKKPLKK